MTTERSDEQSTNNAADELPQEPRQDQPDGAEAGTETEPTGGAASEAGGAGELQAMRDRYLRLAAEYDNYRKRTERERAESWVRAQAQLVERLLEPLDDLQRVAHFAADTATVEALLEGTQMVERKLMRVLEGAGLEVIAAEGKAFDPVQHEALATAATDDPAQDDHVAQVFQKGYQFKGVLLRPARVQVKKHHG